MIPGLELLRDEGVAAVARVPELAADIASYRVIERRPLEGTFGGMRIVTCPAPSRGGPIIVQGLAAIDAQEPFVPTALPVGLVGRSSPDMEARRGSRRSPGRRTSRSSMPTGTRPRCRPRSGRARACSRAASSSTTCWVSST